MIKKKGKIEEIMVTPITSQETTNGLQVEVSEENDMIKISISGLFAITLFKEDFVDLYNALKTVKEEYLEGKRDLRSYG